MSESDGLHQVAWHLTDGRVFRILAHGSPEEAAERMFLIANGEGSEDDPATQRWHAMGHRSLSVGDTVQIDNKLSLYCDSVGWRPAREGDPRCMEERLGIPVNRRSALDDFGL